jgi:site-specific DNA recombinase
MAGPLSGRQRSKRSSLPDLSLIPVVLRRGSEPFAQFEREVTAERIRDKIAASKKKGLWMGGHVPLGYDAKDRTLFVNEAEAQTVRTIFQLYLELGCARRVKEAADRQGLVSKYRRFDSGKTFGGVPFTRGRIYHLLANPV